MAGGESQSPSVMEVVGRGQPQTLQPLQLGERVKQVRLNNGWTLDEVSKRTGLARSTISKIENQQMSPTFDVVQKLAAGLGIDMPQLFRPLSEGRSTGRRAITKKGSGRAHPTATYEHELLATDLSAKRMVPFKSRIRARDFGEFNGWVRHSGEEFLIVLEGSVAFYSEYYEPLVMENGDSAYYDSSMGHALVSLSEDDALVLWVSVE